MPVVNPQVLSLNTLPDYRGFEGLGQLARVLFEQYRRRGPGLYQSPTGATTPVSPAERVAGQPSIRLSDVLQQQAVPFTPGAAYTPSRFPSVPTLPPDIQRVIQQYQAASLPMQQQIQQAQMANLPLQHQQLEAEVAEAPSRRKKLEAETKLAESEAELARSYASLFGGDTEAGPPIVGIKGGKFVEANTPGAKQYLVTPGAGGKPEFKEIAQFGTESERKATRVAEAALKPIQEIRQLLKVQGTKVGDRTPITPTLPFSIPGLPQGQAHGLMKPPAKELRDKLNRTWDLLAMLRTGVAGEFRQKQSLMGQSNIGEFDDDTTIVRRLNDLEKEIRAFATGELSSPLDVSSTEPGVPEVTSVPGEDLSQLSDEDLRAIIAGE